MCYISFRFHLCLVPCSRKKSQLFVLLLLTQSRPILTVEKHPVLNNIHGYKHRHVCRHMYILACRHTDSCMSAYMHIYRLGCLPIYIHIALFMISFIHTYTHTQICTHFCLPGCICTFTCVCMYAHVCLQCVYIHTYRFIDACLHTYTHTYYLYMHAYILYDVYVCKVCMYI